MANSKARCAGCKEYFPRATLRKVGLTNVCQDDGCKTEVLCRQRKVKDRQKKNAESKPTHLGSRLRKAVRNRDGQVCRFCQKTSYRMEVHHITYRSQGGPDHMGNLILLCDTHHAVAHSDKKRWQPVLRAVVWAHYVERRYYTVPQMERRLTAEGLVTR